MHLDLVLVPVERRRVVVLVDQVHGDDRAGRQLIQAQFPRHDGELDGVRVLKVQSFVVLHRNDELAAELDDRRRDFEGVRITVDGQLQFTVVTL